MNNLHHTSAPGHLSREAIKRLPLFPASKLPLLNLAGIALQHYSSYSSLLPVGYQVAKYLWNRSQSAPSNPTQSKQEAPAQPATSQPQSKHLPLLYLLLAAHQHMHKVASYGRRRSNSKPKNVATTGDQQTKGNYQTETKDWSSKAKVQPRRMGGLVKTHSQLPSNEQRRQYASTQQYTEETGLDTKHVSDEDVEHVERSTISSQLMC